jgi:hypothetical protein
MADEAIIQAEYVEWRMVKTRSSLQLIFEVPLEAQERVMQALGVPLPNVSTPVAIARLREAVEPTPQIEHHNDDEPIKPPRPLSQIAAMLCGVGAFQQFIMESGDGWDHRPTTDEAAEWLRSVCGVKSRTELNTNQVAARRFKELRSGYDAWMRVPA